MADKSITLPVQFRGTPSEEAVLGQIGEAVTAGELGYWDSTTERYLLADADTSGASDLDVVFMTDGDSVDDWVPLAFAGQDIDPGYVMAVSDVFYLSVTAGQTADAKPATSKYFSIVGYASATNTMRLVLSASLAQMP